LLAATKSSNASPARDRWKGP